MLKLPEPPPETGLLRWVHGLVGFLNMLIWMCVLLGWMISDLGCIFDKDFLSVLSNVGDLCLTWARTDLIEMKIQGVSFGYRPHEPLGLQRNLNRRAGLGCIFHGSADASIFLSRVHISGSCWRMWGFCMYRWAKLKLGKRNFGRDSVEGTLDWLSLSLEWHCHSAPLVLQSFDINRHEPKCLQLCSREIYDEFYFTRKHFLSARLYGKSPDQKNQWNVQGRSSFRIAYCHVTCIFPNLWTGLVIV